MTSLDATHDHVYVAVWDGRYLSEIYRFTPQGVGGGPALISGHVTDIDIGKGDCEVVYATERGVGRLDSCTGTRLEDLLPRLPARAVRLLPDATVLVAPSNSGRILRVRGDGRVVARYGRRQGKARWAAIDLAPDGSAFWAVTTHGRLVRFALARRGGETVTMTPAAAALAVVGAPRGAAPPANAAPPAGGVALDGVEPLTGESFFTVSSGRTASPFACASTSPSTLHFESEGSAVGPYGGSYGSALDVAFGPQKLPLHSGLLGVDVGSVTSFGGKFEVRAGGVHVRGALRTSASAPANTAACLAFTDRTFPFAFAFPPNYRLSGYYLDAHLRRLSYTARIQSGGKTYADQGASSLFTDEYYLTDDRGELAGSSRQYLESFVSSSLSVDDRFASLRSSRRHSLAIGRGRRSVTLELRWKEATDAFAVTGVRPASPRASAGRVPARLRITVLHHGRGVERLRITGLRPGRVSFTVRALRLAGTGRVNVAVGQS